MNYPMTSSSPITEALPSPNLTEPNLSSPKNMESNPAGPSNTAAAVTPGTSPMLSAILRSITNKPKELNITEYSNKELKSMKKRCRTVMTASQSRVLRKVLEQTAFPSTEIRENLAKILGMKPRTVQIWFQNQRQKSRQGRSSDDLSVMDSPDGGSSEETDDIDDPLSSPYCSPAAGGTPSSTSPGFTALSAAAFALANTPLNTPLDPNVSLNEQQQRYTTFHGAVFKSTPGCISMIGNGNHRGNTAAAINAKRNSGVLGNATAGALFVPGSAQPGFLPPPPTQPQKIPSYPQSHSHSHAHVQGQSHGHASHGQSHGQIHSHNHTIQLPHPHQHQHPYYYAQAAGRSNNEAIPLDVLASAVSNFRPNGYNYFMGPQQMVQRSMMTPQPQQQQNVQSQQQQQHSIHPHASAQINRNRLAPLRTPSPPTSVSCPSSSSASNSPETKLPSLKALAQVASIGMEIEQEQRRSKSLSVEGSASSSTDKFLPPVRRFSAEISNASAPNSAARRPW